MSNDAAKSLTTKHTNHTKIGGRIWLPTEYTEDTEWNWILSHVGRWRARRTTGPNRCAASTQPTPTPSLHFQNASGQTAARSMRLQFSVRQFSVPPVFLSGLL